MSNNRRNHPTARTVIVEITAHDMTTTRPEAMGDTEFDVYTWGPLVDPKGDTDRVWGVD